MNCPTGYNCEQHYKTHTFTNFQKRFISSITEETYSLFNIQEIKYTCTLGMKHLMHLKSESHAVDYYFCIYIFCKKGIMTQYNGYTK